MGSLAQGHCSTRASSPAVSRPAIILLLFLCGLTSCLAATYPVSQAPGGPSGQCDATWFVNKSSGCVCGSRHGNAIKCNERTGRVSIIFGYCMTYDEVTQKTVMGYCPYNIFFAFKTSSAYTTLPTNVTELNDFMCTKFLDRTGQLCGRCRSGYSPGIYSYEHKCMNCTQEGLGKKIAVVLLTQFLPATLFFFVIVVFRINASSGVLCAFVFFSQQASLPAPAVFLLQAGQFLDSSFVTEYSKILLSLYGVWNLDYFRPFVSEVDVCLGKDVSIIPVLVMGYIMPVYCLTLTIITYVAIELHARGWRPVVWLWRPFHRCFFSFRQTWNVSASIIDAFVTLILLSYAKTVYLAISAVYFVELHYPTGPVSINRYFFFDASVQYGTGLHLLLLLLSFFLLSTVVLCPIVVLIFYQFKWFQRLLHKCRLNRQGLRAFVEVFQGCYRDGVDGGYDLRFFAGLYLLFRGLIVVVLVGVYGIGDLSLTFVFCMVVMSLCVALTFALLRPYKRFRYNVLDTLFFALLSAIFSAVLYAVNIEFHNTGHWFQAAYVIILVLLSLPAVYFTAVVLYWIYLKVRRRNRSRSDVRSLSSASGKLPDRLTNPSRYQSLNTDSTAVETSTATESAHLLEKDVSTY